MRKVYLDNVATTPILQEVLETGQVLEILADDEGIKENMPAWCRTTGNELLGTEEEAGLYKIYSGNPNRKEEPSKSRQGEYPYK